MRIPLVTPRPPPDRRREVRLAAALTLAMAAIFVTPYGAAFIKVPFVSTEVASSYINELSQLPVSDYFTYSLSVRGFTTLTVTNVLLLVAILAAVAAAARGRLRPSHLLMFLGGLVLLSKAVRLSHECMLLCLPLIKSGGALLPAWPGGRTPGGRTANSGSEASSDEGRRRKVAAVVTVLTVALLATPYLYLVQRLPHLGQEYPLSQQNLPHGIANFLNHVDAGGRVMNNPNVGGYLLWTLHPDYQIFMDLEIPFLFTDEDLYQVASAFFDAEALRQFIALYQPDFIAATLASSGFAELIAAHPDYVPVYFDDQGVLYADGRRHGEVAARHRLATVDPYNLGRTRFSALAAGERRDVLAELQRIDAIDPGISRVNQALAILHNLDGRHAEALEHATRVIRRDPGLARGHAIRGDALSGRGETAAAITAYRRALRRSTDSGEKSAIYRSLSAAYLQAGRDCEAYEALRGSVGIFNIEASPFELFNLGILAARCGEVAAAHKLLGFARLKVPPGEQGAPDEQSLRRAIDEQLAALGGATAP